MKERIDYRKSARRKAMRQYHSVLSKHPGGKWAIQFGDYDKETAKEEMADMKSNHNLWPKGTKFKIITTGDKQKDIQAAVDKLNKSGSLVPEQWQGY